MIALSIVANATALVLLRVAWGRKRGGFVMLLAWLCFAGAILSWSLSRGESGVAESLLFFSMLAAAYVGALFLRAPRAAVVPSAARPAREPSAFGRRAVLFGGSVLAATIGALSLSAAWFVLAAQARWTQPDTIVSTVLISTIAWPILFAWLLMEQSAPRRLLIMLALVAPGAVTFVLA